MEIIVAILLIRFIFALRLYCGVNANIKMFRATFAGNLFMSSVDIFAVSKLLGHHEVKITEKR